jgi:menaquinone-dependent protoporphyrinogen IX oxidase
MLNNEKKVAVIYKSKYGSTKGYAEWIARDVDGDLFESSKIRIEDLSNYDTIVFGGSLHAVGITGVKLITDNFEKLRNKKIVVFAIGCSPAREEAIKHVKNHNFAVDIKDKIEFFYLRGAFNYNKLNFIDKIMMALLKRKLKKKKEELDEDSKGLLASYDNPVDWTDEKAIVPIVKYIME